MDEAAAALGPLAGFADAEAPVICAHADVAGVWITEWPGGQVRVCVTCMDRLRGLLAQSQADGITRLEVEHACDAMGLLPKYTEELVRELTSTVVRSA
jgi:hypothetical protein